MSPAVSPRHAPSTDPRSYVSYKNLSSPSVEGGADLTFDAFADRLIGDVSPRCPEEKPSKADKSRLGMWSPVKLREPYRKNEHVEYVSCAVGDLDDEQDKSIDEIAARFEGLNFLVTNTPSSVRRYRTIVDTDRPILASEYPRFFEGCRKLFGFTVDEKTRDVSRQWSESCQPLDGAFEFRRGHGLPLPVDEVLASITDAEMANTPSTAPKPTEPLSLQDLPEELHGAARAVGEAWGKDCPPETKNRHYSSGTIASCLFRKGVNHEQIPAFVRIAAQVAGFSKLDDKENYAITTVENSLAGNAVDGWIKLEKTCPNVVKVLDEYFTPKQPNFMKPAPENDTKAAPNPKEPAPEDWGIIDWNAVDPPVAWLVDKIIQEATVSVAFGLPNSLKTWTCYKFAECVSSGKPWLGRLTKKGLVVILDYESSARQARRRMRLLKAEGLDIRYINPDQFLNDPKLWERIAKLKPTLVIVDSLARGMIGIEENTTPMQVPFDYAKRLARDCGAATVFVHHKNKSGKDGQAGLRGSTAIYAAAEGALEFLDFVRINADVQRARLHCDRLKESIAFEDIHLELSDAKGLVEIAGAAPMQKAEFTVKGAQARILLHAHSNPNVGKKELLRLAGLTNSHDKIGAQALDELVSDGRMNKIKRGTGHIYAPPASHKVQEDAVMAAVDAGITGQADILKAAPQADLETLVRMSGKKLIYKMGTGGWLKCGCD